MARPKTHSERMIILERIIGLVKEQGRITTNDVVAIFGVHRTTAEKYLQIALVRGGFIRHGRCGVFRDQRAVIDYDLSEWADMQFLLWDAQRRAGISDEQITQAMVEKLAVNKQREWPEPKDGEPRLHIKAQPAPVVPEEMPKGLAGQIVSLLAHNIGDKFLAQKIWNACRAALLQGSQPVSNCDELQVIGWLRSDYNSDDKRDPDAPLFMLGSNNPSETWGVKYMPLTGNSPVTPDGWISCSERMPEDEQEVIVQNKLGYRYVSYFDEHSGLFFDMRGGNQINCIEHILVTHWRPMSVPPQH
ncbi:DUF977 family protein [Salmonella enterica]|nr:DUF977 family protein [Salmonella enterica]